MFPQAGNTRFSIGFTRFYDVSGFPARAESSNKCRNLIMNQESMVFLWASYRFHVVYYKVSVKWASCCDQMGAMRKACFFNGFPWVSRCGRWISSRSSQPTIGRYFRRGNPSIAHLARSQNHWFPIAFQWFPLQGIILYCNILESYCNAFACFHKLET